MKFLAMRDDAAYDDSTVVHLNPELMEKVYALVKDVPVETTEITRNYMKAAFDGADWAVRAGWSLIRFLPDNSGSYRSCF